MRTVTHARDLEAPTRKRGVVMTMGALHEGHLALVRAARETCDEVVVTIFVNPLQFNDAADLERYPRTLEADSELLRASGVDVLFAPSVAEVYPAGDPIVTVYTAKPDGSIEVYTDMTEDRFGGGISVQICPEATTVLDLGACDELNRGD